MTKMTKLFWIFVDETKTKTKIRTGDENEIKINGVLVMTKISDEKLALTAFIRLASCKYWRQLYSVQCACTIAKSTLFMFLLSVDVDNINGKPEIRTVNKQVADCQSCLNRMQSDFSCLFILYFRFSIANCDLLFLSEPVPFPLFTNRIRFTFSKLKFYIIAMAVSTGRKRESLVWDFFDYDSPKAESVCKIILVVSSDKWLSSL